MVFEKLLISKSARVILKKNNFIYALITSNGGIFDLYKRRILQSDRAYFSNMASSQSKPKFTNRLAKEKSPYLLQHAHNPVDWYPWGDEAFKRARKENKMIFLSVGYSTCHWCHVMEKESFENEDIAKIMNENFVCIKVDREERPDVDKLYMTFIQATAGRGGWPMSAWLTPDLQAVYGGTYYPPQDRYGMPGFGSILLSLAKQWNNKREKFIESGKQIMEAIKESSSLGESSKKVPNESCWTKCFQQLEKSFEPRFGGFSPAPKFPQPVNMNFLLHLYARNKEGTGKKALEMVTYTLEKMAKGGIHDHVAQGFARYSTDTKWHVPHFEKMLYDQGQLAVCYANAYAVTKNALFADMVRDIMTYVFRDLSHPLGGFYSAEDADSYPDKNSTEKREGAFCVWTFKEIKEHLKERVEGKTDLTFAEVFSYHFSVHATGNVSPAQDPHNELTNQNVLINFGSETETANHFSLTLEETKTILKKCCDILFEVRKQRPRPHLDDKMITAWNGLMISGVSKAAQILQDKSYVERAVLAAQFVEKYLYSEDDQTLLRSCYNGGNGLIIQIESPIHGFLEDYAFLIRGLLDLYEACFDPIWLAWANKLQETQNRIFWDDEDGGYFGSPLGDSSLLIRLKEDQDGAEPSGNSVSVHNLLRLSTLLNIADYKKKAEIILTTFSTRLTQVPFAIPEMVSGLMLLHDSPTQIFIAGQLDGADTKELLTVINSRLIPGRVVAIADGRRDSILYEKNDTLRDMKSVENKATAYVCRQHVCYPVVNSVEELTALLDSN